MLSRNENKPPISERLEGLRKFWITVLALVSFNMIMLLSATSVDPMNLGLGLGFLLSPIAAANAYEHYSKRSQT